uniref:Uncharacterized protein n=1 Tax=Timema monikensis TaxID=170555 RepID=A0A7R9HU76_9NEOP|nr:unnamed protein product [Timema monikensis]
MPGSVTSISILVSTRLDGSPNCRQVHIIPILLQPSVEGGTSAPSRNEENDDHEELAVRSTAALARTTYLEHLSILKNVVKKLLPVVLVQRSPCLGPGACTALVSQSRPNNDVLLLPLTFSIGKPLYTEHSYYPDTIILPNTSKAYHMYVKGTLHVGDVVLPGDKVCEISEDQKKRVILGPGLRLNVDQVLISKCGILRMKNANVYWVDSHQKRYIPSRGETVVGVVTTKSGEVFRVDIGSSDQASLSYLAFEGATKKLRPDVNVGDIVFARLITASRDMEPELICVDSYGKAGKYSAKNFDEFQEEVLEYFEAMETGTKSSGVQIARLKNLLGRDAVRLYKTFNYHQT